MAWHFDESNDYVTMADSPVSTLPDGDWTIAGKLKLDDNVGTAFQYFLSAGNFAANPSLNFYINEATEATVPNALSYFMGDDDTTDMDAVGGTPGTSTLWQHIAYVRSGNTITSYVNNVAAATDTDVNFAAVNLPTDLNFGRRSDGNADRYFGGDMAEWAKWDVALNASQRASLVAGYAPSFFPNSIKWYVSMIREYQELINGLTMTNNGSTVVAHPFTIYPDDNVIPFPSAAVGGVILTNNYRTLLGGDII